MIMTTNRTFEDLFPAVTEKLVPCNYDKCVLKEFIEMNPAIDKNEKCRTNDSRRGTRVIKDNRWAHATYTVVQYRDMCGLDLSKLTSIMPTVIKNVLKNGGV